MKHIAFPFLTLSQSDPDVSDWSLVSDDGSEQPLKRLVAGWGYERNLRIQRTFHLSPGLVTSRLALDVSSSSFELLVRIGTGTGTLPRRLVPLSRTELLPGVPFLVDATVNGDQLSNRLFLECSIIAHKSGGARSVLAPTLHASIVWRDTLDLMLEGQAPRFPMEIVSFAERFAGRSEAEAPWFVHWLPGELHRDFGGAVRLYINHDNPEFVERFVSADVITLQATLGGVMNQIVTSVITREEIESVLDDAEPNSIAGHVKMWLELAFPSLGVAAIRERWRTNPGEFQAAILAAARPEVSEIPG